MKVLADRGNRLLKRDRADRMTRGSGRRRCDANRSDMNDKRAYTSQGAARRAAVELSEQHMVSMFPYRCHCGRWHLTKEARASRP